MQMNPEKIYRLFATCIPVKGYCRSAIVDTQRHKLHLIPNMLYSLLTEESTKNFGEIVSMFDPESGIIVTEYYQFLLTNELIFGIDKEESDCFPDLPLQWDFPSLCSNAILDIDSESRYDIRDALYTISSIPCFHLQLRLFGNFSFYRIREWLRSVHSCSFRSVQLLFASNEILSEEHYRQWMEEYPKIAKIEAFGSSEDRLLPVCGMERIIIFRQKCITSPRDCGCIDPRYFPVELQHVAEARQFNTCLNRKLSVDINGYVKNCPSMDHHFGHISEISPEAIMEHPEFQKYWTIRKDEIDVCRDCEFRYVCTDCRCFTMNPENLYSQPSKCTYNPYLGKWEKEEGYVPVRELDNV